MHKLDDFETIARFIVYKRHFNASLKKVYPPAFEPRRKHYDLSVYRIKDCHEDEIWDIAEEYVTKLRSDKRKVLARAELLLQIIKQYDLRLNPNGEPHPRHLNIEDWPSEKEKQKMIQVELANKAILIQRLG